MSLKAIERNDFIDFVILYSQEKIRLLIKYDMSAVNS